MRKILIVGAGQSGLQLALGLQSHGYEVTLISSRSADEIRGGRVMSTQCMFDTALQHERDLGINFWEDQTRNHHGLGLSVAAPPGSGDDGGRAINWVGRLDAPAQSVDQRVKMAGWLETFAERGGRLVIQDADLATLDAAARGQDLVLVSVGRGELASMFERDATRSPYDVPQRALAAAYVHGLGVSPDHPEDDGIRCNLVPGVGELFVMATHTLSGRADALLWEGVPGGPLDVFQDVTDPNEHLATMLDLMRRYTPWEYARATEVQLTDAGGTLAGRFTPTVRHPVGRLPGGGLALGMADAVVTNDPITGQGANTAAKSAAAYLSAILEHGDRPFDEAWMRATFDRHWTDTARHVTKWSTIMLTPPPEHVLNLLGAAGQLQPVADRFANAFDHPADLEDFFYEPRKVEAYLAEVSAAQSPN